MDFHIHIMYVTLIIKLPLILQKNQYNTVSSRTPPIILIHIIPGFKITLYHELPHHLLLV